MSVLGDLDLKQRVEQVLSAEVRPALQSDGGDVEVLDVVDGVVRVRLHGTCGGCPSSVLTVVMGVERALRQRVPEVEYLEAVP